MFHFSSKNPYIDLKISTSIAYFVTGTQQILKCYDVHVRGLILQAPNRILEEQKPISIISYLFKQLYNLPSDELEDVQMHLSTLTL